MFCSADSVGWAASKLIFIFPGHFVAEECTFFDKPAGSSKKQCVFEGFAAWASNKTGRQRKTHFVAVARYFF